MPTRKRPAAADATVLNANRQFGTGRAWLGAFGLFFLTLMIWTFERWSQAAPGMSAGSGRPDKPRGSTTTDTTDRQ